MQRRDFIKGSTLGFGALLTGVAGTACTSVKEAEETVSKAVEKGKSRKQLFNMCGYAAPAIPTVRIGYVGIGSRGSCTHGNTKSTRLITYSIDRQ